jgi:hypothetical protein
LRLEDAYVRVEVNGVFAVAFIKVLKLTRFLWYPGRRSVLRWTRRNIRRFVIVRVLR